MLQSVKQFILNLLPGTFRSNLKQFKNSILEFIYRIFSSNVLFSKFYYFFLSNKFNRELQGVLFGKYKYFSGKYGKEVLLRRNVHRLEKGLIMQPRRKVFARTYILETVKAYRILLKESGENSLNAGEIQWTHDVLEEYFNIVGESDSINEARNIYNSINSMVINKDFKPYKRVVPESSIAYDQLLNLSKQRRSVRWYKDKKVPRELIDKAITVAALSPSACNRQPFVFRIFDDPELVQEVASIPMGTKGFYHQFPMIIALVGKLDAYFDERDRHVIYIDASLAAMSFMYALETLGLSSCPINWPDIQRKEKQLSNLLHLEHSDRVIMFISVGYADKDALIPYSYKKSLDQIRSYNKL